jgi:uncharacterized membrane protein YheB (UPF0754 family)
VKAFSHTLIRKHATMIAPASLTKQIDSSLTTYQDFEQLLHPVFQADEWKLIVVGGGLGLAIGLLQAYFIN